MLIPISVESDTCILKFRIIIWQTRLAVTTTVQLKFDRNYSQTKHKFVERRVSIALFEKSSQRLILANWVR